MSARRFCFYALLLGLAVASGSGGFYMHQATSDNNYSTNTQTGKIFIVGDHRPNFSLPDLDGEQHTSANWDGKVVLLNFWASWCLPCIREIPAFQEIYQSYRGKGVAVVGIAFDEPKNVRLFLDRVTVTYPMLYGQLRVGALMKQLGNTHGVLPYTVVIDKNARIAAIAARGELNYRQIETLLEPLLASKKSP